MRAFEEKLEAVNLLYQVIGDQLGHLKHGHGALAIEHGFQSSVSVDLGLLLFILELVSADVIPELLGQFSAGKWIFANDGCKFIVGLNGFKKCCVGFFGGSSFSCHGRAC